MNKRPIIRKPLNIALAVLAAGLPLTLALWAGPIQPASAHGVFIFAWDEGDRICTDSYFSKSSKVQGGTVTMRNAAGQVLQSGLTDKDGGLCLPRPARPEDLIFVIEAGEGHRAEFKLRAADLSNSIPTAASEAVAPEASGPPSAGPEKTSEVEENLRRIVREELQTQLGPLRKALAESQRGQEPGLREIVGGLGWVAGLFGLAFWWTGRKKK
jgi:hypothetical protein